MLVSGKTYKQPHRGASLLTEHKVSLLGLQENRSQRYGHRGRRESALKKKNPFRLHSRIRGCLESKEAEENKRRKEGKIEQGSYGPPIFPKGERRKNFKTPARKDR